jgi:hypothetical protein
MPRAGALVALRGCDRAASGRDPGAAGRLMDDALGYLGWCIGWEGGSVPVYLDAAQTPNLWLAARELPDQLERRLTRWEGRQVEIGLPQARAGLGVVSSTVLWVWVESRDSAARLAKRFKPLPSIVLRIGASCRRLCLWPLHEVAPWVLLENSNKRIAYALHAPQKYAEPEKLRVPVPGTAITAGRKRPAPVSVTRLELPTFAREQVVGRLRDPPAPYMQRLREGRVSR